MAAIGYDSVLDIHVNNEAKLKLVSSKTIEKGALD